MGFLPRNARFFRLSQHFPIILYGHTYAVNAIRAGDDIKTISENMGHATVAFTLDVYGHVTEQMKKDSGAKMEAFMKNVLGL